MCNMYDTILSPIDYGGMQLKNRIIFAPTTFGLSDEEYLAEMERLAKGGCAMIIIGDVPVAKSRFEKSLFDKKGFAFYQQICETAHKYGCKVCAQLHQTDTDKMCIRDSSWIWVLRVPEESKLKLKVTPGFSAE